MGRELGRELGHELGHEGVRRVTKGYERDMKGLRNVRVVALNDLTDESDNSHDQGFYLYHAMIQNSPD